MVIACAACSSNETNKHVEVIKVCTETAQESNYSKGESYVGTVEADVAVAVSFTGMGTIKQVHVSEGARVRKGHCWQKWIRHKQKMLWQRQQPPTSKPQMLTTG